MFETTSRKLFRPDSVPLRAVVALRGFGNELAMVWNCEGSW